MPSRYYYCQGGSNININLFQLLLKTSRKPKFKTLVDHLYGRRRKSRFCFTNLKSTCKRCKNKQKILSTLSDITINEYLKILARQRSLPSFPASSNDEGKTERHCSDMRLHTSTLLKAQCMLLNPTIMPPEYLVLLKNPLTRAQPPSCQYHRSLTQNSYRCSYDCDTAVGVMKSLLKLPNKNANRRHQLVTTKHKMQKTKKAIKISVSKPKFDLTTPYSARMIKKKTILKDLVTLAVPIQAENSLNKLEECMHFPLEENMVDHNVKLPNCFHGELSKHAAGKTFEFECNTETVGRVTNLPAKQILPLDENIALVRQKTVNKKKKSNLFSVEKNKIKTNELGRPQDVSGNTGNTDQEKYPTYKMPRSNTHLEDETLKITTREPLFEDFNLKSEKTLMNVVRKEVRKARAVSLWTPIEGKKPKQKEKLLRGLVQHGITLPEGNTESIKNLISKVRKEMGLPPSPKTNIDKERYAAAQAIGLITPLNGKTAPQKERILRALAKRNIPLPEGRTASEKVLISKIGKEGKPVPEKKTASKVSLFNKTEQAVRVPVELAVDTGNENYTNGNLHGDLVKSSKRQIDPRKEKVLNRSRTRHLINLLKKLPMSSRPSTKLSKETYNMPRKITEVNYLTLLRETKKVNSKELETDLVVAADKKTKYCINSQVDRRLSFLEGMSRQEKEILLNPFAEKGAVLPKVKFAFKKSVADIDTTKVLSPIGTIRAQRALKVKAGILKDGVRILSPLDIREPLPKVKKRTFSKKLMTNKASMLFKNKAPDKALGFGELGNTTHSNLANVKKVMSTATYTGSLRLESAKLSTPYIGEEFMTSAQKSIVQVLSTYLANIEVEE